jgi:chromate transporter
MTEVFLVFLRLGCTAFGGPVAHLAVFRDEFVLRRRWLDERRYADLVGLCQVLPGPSSSQVAMAIGLLRSGRGGALAAWAGFTLPSATLLASLAAGLTSHPELLSRDGLLRAMQAVVVAVVGLAVLSMARNLCPDGPKRAVLVASAAACLALPGPWTPYGCIAIAAMLGYRFPSDGPPPASTAPLGRVGVGFAAACLASLALLLALLPYLAQFAPVSAVALIDALVRAGTLVFGGGHVVLPLLEAEVVTRGWVAPDTFLAGYGVTQAMPGPLFSYAAFVGYVSSAGPGAWAGAIVATLAIFLPAALVLFGSLPFWEGLRSHARAQAALGAVSAAVVGVLLATWWDPVCTRAIRGLPDLALAAAAWIALGPGRLPAWLVVAAAALVGALTG